MQIKDIPQEVYKKALELKGLDTTRPLPENWDWEHEYSYQEDRSGFSNGELNKALAEYLINNGEWSTR